MCCSVFLFPNSLFVVLLSSGNVFVPECMCELQDFSTIECEGGEEADDEDNSRPYQDLKVSNGFCVCVCARARVCVCVCVQVCVGVWV